MQVFRVDDMTCGHCVGAITKAIQSVAPAATVEVELGQHQVSVGNTAAHSATLIAAIAEAGYHAEVLNAQLNPRPEAARRAGCCGCCS